jgi:hydroxyethylthiazole kinase
LAYFGLAGEHAARGATGPGSFQTAFLDALAAIGPEDLSRDARVTRA